MSDDHGKDKDSSVLDQSYYLGGDGSASGRFWRFAPLGIAILLIAASTLGAIWNASILGFLGIALAGHAAVVCTFIASPRWNTDIDQSTMFGRIASVVTGSILAALAIGFVGIRYVEYEEQTSARGGVVEEGKETKNEETKNEETKNKETKNEGSGRKDAETSEDDNSSKALSRRIKELHSIKYKLVLIFAGAVGGILWGMSHDRGLRMPVLITGLDSKTPEDQSTLIELGWVGDALYGAAGAFTVFLITPNLSEGLVEEKLDVIEIMAVALVGGFSARSIMASMKSAYDTNDSGDSSRPTNGPESVEVKS